jgi:ABC-2 type transport system ATP-binding protein
MSEQPVIEFGAVSKQYGAVTALDNVSLAIARGGLTSILGPNGAGKTTLLGLVLGQTAATRGSVRVFGAAPGSQPVRARIGAMLQATTLPAALTVRETIEVFADYYSAPHDVDAVLQMAGLAAVADRRYNKLSGGQQRRVQFAVAVCGRPELLLLDEPTVALDAEARRTAWTVIRDLVARGSTVILTTHQLDEAEALSDRVVVLAAGRVVADGSAAHVKSTVSARRVQCVTSVTPEIIQRWHGVRAARRSGQHTEVLCDRAENVVRELLAQDPALSDLTVAGSTLEDAVLELTRGPQR